MPNTLYYGSFGYRIVVLRQVRVLAHLTTLKKLVDTAHGMGLAGDYDLVQSHAVRNEIEGLSRYDGSYGQYFHAGDRGEHSQWDSRVFDYGKPEVAHFC